MADTVTSSPCRKNRGTASRTIRFFLTMTRSIVLPTRVSVVIPRTVARHVVSESGNVSCASARPRESVRMSASHKAVSGKTFRTLGSTMVSDGFNCASARRFPTNRIQRLIDDSETQLAFHRFSVGISRHEGVSGFVARLKLFLRRLNFNLQFLLHRRHFQAFSGLIQLVVVQEDSGNKDVRLIAALYWNLYGHRWRRGVYDFLALHGSPFRRNQQIGIRHTRHHQHARLVSHFVGFLIHHDSNLAFLPPTPPVFSSA